MVRQTRVTRYSVPLGRSKQVQITLRKFRTRRANRSKKIRQLVLPTGFTYYKEISIVFPRRKRFSKRRGLTPRLAYSSPLMLLGAAGIIYFGLNLKAPVTLGLVSTPVVTTATRQAAPVAPKSKTLAPSVPLALHIPKIAIDAPLVPVGLQPTGAITMPDGFDIAGWYSNGPTPGELGPSVIVGHVDSTEGIAIFWRLRELVPGDMLTIDRQDGTTATFKVLEIQQYSQGQFPTSDVYGDIKYAGLRIITCGGTFDSETHHYSDNTVVYAALQ